MSRVLTVAWRDFRYTVVTKAFLFAIVGVPILIVVASVVAAVLVDSQKQPPLIGTVAIVEATSDVADAVRLEFVDDAEGDSGGGDEEAAPFTDRAADVEGFAELAMTGAPGGGSAERGEVRVTIEAITTTPAEGEDAISAEAKQKITDGEYLAVASIPPLLLVAPDELPGSTPYPRFELLVGDGLDSDHVSLIEDRIGRAVVRVRAQRAGVDADATLALLREPRSRTSKQLASGEVADESELVRAARQFMIPFGFLMLLWAATMFSGNYLLTSTIEEKSNKVMEVLLSEVSPLQLMTGKIVGQGLVGLLVMAVYSSISIVGLLVAAQLDLVQPMQLVFLGVFFFMAYFMVASLMAAVGSAVTDIREANSLMMPVMLIMMLPLMLWMPISQAPNGPIALAGSFIPPAIPFVMVIRIAADEAVPLWQIPASIIWGYTCVVAMVWLAARIFRVGVLMQGKPPSPIELIKWLRYS